jgi:hypothetical protein
MFYRYDFLKHVDLLRGTPNDKVPVLESFFTEMAESGEFISQLLAFEKSKENITDLIDLCKSNTDKDTELKALAEFRDARHAVVKLVLLHSQPGVQIPWEEFLGILAFSLL